LLQGLHARWQALSLLVVACSADPSAPTAPRSDSRARDSGISHSDTGAYEAGELSRGDAASGDGTIDARADSGGFHDGAAWPPPKSATSLPLEVLGAPGVAVEIDIELDAAAVAAARAAGSAALELTVHNVVAPDSAIVVVNGGPPLDLGAPSGPFLRRVDGRVASGKIAVDPGTLVAGKNQIVFRYTRQIIDVAAVSGFRVLGAAIALGTDRFSPTLSAEDPSTWAPLDASVAAIERGRGFFQDVSRDGGPACARCHADSGADLQYYAFSTNSIVERAMFHEFSRADAEDIASYIRSLPLAPTGRPYDPPFQPGSGNHAAAGAGYDAALADDAAFATAAFAGTSLPASPAWNWAEAIDTFTAPAAINTPTWFRWLPRELLDDWFTRQGGVLASAERALATDPSLDNARTFMSAALTVGKDVLQRDGDYQGKVEVLRFAAVKLWDWSRQNGFDRPDHGAPDGSPAYPYEVGFAFFEASQAGVLAGSERQTMEWWWTQLATNPGRGLSTGLRPLNFADVLSAAEGAEMGPAEIGFLHLYGSWEESRGAVAATWGTGEGPVRLLLVPMRALPAADREVVLRRFLIREAEFLTAGGTLDSGHHAKLAEAWTRGCAALASSVRASLRSLAPAAVAADLTACP
jgi:cytochrome c553